MSREPTICQVLHGLNVGGAEVLAAGLARELRDRYRFVFACLEELGTLGEELREEGFVVEVIGRRPGIDFHCMRRLAELWKRERVDLVHAHQYTPFFYALAARRGGRRPPVLFTEHGRWFPDRPRLKRIIFNRLLLRRGDRIVGVGEAVRHALIVNEGISARRVEVVYNGVDAAAFEENGIDRAAIRREIGVGSDDFVIIQVARLDHLKDHATAIRTIGRIASVRPDARLVLVGEGPERPKIEAEIAQRRVEPQVRLLGLRHDIARLLAAADVFLLTSISEGIPVTLIEAMAARLPVVSSDVGGVSEVIEPGKTGLVTASGDDAALARAVLRMAEDPAMRHEMGQRGRRRAEDVFSRDRMHAAYRARYEEMLRE
jgi:L-malate glycosyltransferase